MSIRWTQRKWRRRRAAVITYMRGNGWLLTYDIWRNLRIRMPMLFAVLDELEDAGLVESQWCECFTPRRRVYRLIQEERP